MFVRHIILIALFAGVSFVANSQEALSDLKIGQWKQHLPWKRANFVTSAPGTIFFSGELGLLEWNTQERNARFFTKVEGLNDVGLSMVRYSRTAQTLFIAYSNSNIDLKKGDRIINMPVISKNNFIIGDKQINDVAFSEKRAFLACSFGVVVIDLEREEVVSTTFTNRVVRSITVFNDKILAGTDDGLFSLPTNDGTPEDFGRWEYWDESKGMPSDYSVSAMTTAQDGKLFLGIGKAVYLWENNLLTLVASDAIHPVRYITAESEGVVMGFRETFLGRVVYRAADGTVRDIQNTCNAIRPLYAVEEKKGEFWFADFDDDFMHYTLSTDQCERLTFNSPFNQRVTDIAIAPDNSTYITTPGPVSGLAARYAKDGIFTLKDGEWGRISAQSHPELVADACENDLWRVAIRPSDGTVFAGSFVGGLVEFTTPTAKCYTQYNSPLLNAGASGTTLTAIGGLAFDASENLWISNFNAAKPIAVLKKDGTISNFAAPVSPLLQVVVDKYNLKWFTTGFNSGVMVYDSGSNLEDPSDDRYKLINSGNSVLTTPTINCLAVDKSGDVWVGTQQGVVSFECGSNVFDSECRGSRRIVEVDGFNAYLLETEDVRCIAVDGANRKWFGTTNGVFVQSADGREQIAQYNTFNSPLFDNNINAIAINPKNGEVWIGTEKGVQSLRTEATDGGRINSLNIYAYPNPVRPDYDGPIAVKGLAADANIKITDAAGLLVFEGKSFGGQAIWDGRDYLGRKAASGVYLVFSTSTADFENPDAAVAKIVIIR